MKISLIFLILFLTAATLSSCSLFMNQEPKPPVEVELDLSKSHRLSDVGWTPENKSNFYSHTEDMLMTLKLPGGKVFKGRIKAFYCSQTDGENLSEIVLHTHKMTVDEAYEEARRLITYWNLDYKNLDRWRIERNANVKVIDDRFESIKNDANPPLAVRILNSFNDEKPWYIAFEVSFK